MFSELNPRANRVAGGVRGKMCTKFARHLWLGNDLNFDSYREIYENIRSST